MLLQPDRHAALEAKRRLALAVVDSSLTVLAGLERVHAVDDAQARVALGDALGRLRDAAASSEYPGEVVEPEFYEWYFRAIALVEAREFSELDRHVERLAFIVALPLARLRMLGDGVPLRNRARASLYFGEREFPLLVDPRDGELVATSDGETLRVVGRDAYDVLIAEILGDGRFRLQGHRLSLQQAGWARHREVRKYAEDQGRIHGQRFHFRLLSPDTFRDAPDRLERYQAGLDRLMSVWPEMASELDVLTDSVSAMVGLPFVGGSDLACFGTSFFYLDPEWSPLCYADHLTHEASHQRLHAELELTPALVNPADVSGDSPIRSDPRPLEGTLHATFVFMRLAQLFERAETAADDDRPEALIRLHRHLLGFYQGMDVLSARAEFTDWGREIFAEMQGEMNRMRRSLPKPASQFYEQLNVDYLQPSLIGHQ